MGSEALDSFVIKIAGKNVRISTRFPDTAMKYMKDYIVPEDSFDIDAVVSDGELRDIMSELSAENAALGEITNLYRPIAEKMPFYDSVVFHGAAVEYGGRGYVFTAPSGTGKSTHIALWQKYVGDVKIINGDKPILKAYDDKTLVCSTPWAGKEHWQRNVSRRLCGICLMCRSGEDNKSSIERIVPKDALDFLLNQTYIPQNPESLVATLGVLDRILKVVPVYKLTCDISKDAVKCSFEALTGEKLD